MPHIHAALPSDFDLTRDRFFEPFAGGGAVMFSLAAHTAAANLTAPRKRKQGLPIVINDVNPDLVAAYQSIRDDVDELVELLAEMGKHTSQDDYYEIRDSAPITQLERGARMIYLNRTGFNGLHRVNSSGKFNVPYGKLANQTVCDEPLLRACSRWLQHVEIRTGSFSAAISDAKRGDVVYFDPPYVPLSATASFSKYAKDNFLEFDQWALAGVIRGLKRRGVRVVFSNSNAPLTREIYADDGLLDLRVISAARSIAASKTSRSRVEEVLGISFDVTECADPAKIAALPTAADERTVAA